MWFCEWFIISTQFQFLIIAAATIVYCYYSTQELEGQLLKHTNMMKGWQPRYFRLDPKQAILSYYIVSILKLYSVPAHKFFAAVLGLSVTDQVCVMMNVVAYINVECVHTGAHKCRKATE